MLSVLDLVDLLEEVRRFTQKRDFAAVAELLEGFPQHLLTGEPELGHSLAQAMSQLDRANEAEELLEELDISCSTRGDDRLFRRRRNLWAVLYIRRGDLDRAQHLLREVQVSSQLAGDEMFLATATMNLGVLADMRCQWREATTHYQYALVLFQRLGDIPSMAGLYHNLGMLHRQLGQLDEAEAYFERALENYNPDGTIEERISTEIERSFTIGERGDLDRALALARHTYEIADRIDNNRLQAECLRAVGAILVKQGEFDLGRQTLTTALANVPENELLRAELLEELAVLCTLEGRQREASRHTTASTAAYDACGAAERGKLLLHRLSEAQKRSSRLSS